MGRGCVDESFARLRLRFVVLAQASLALAQGAKACVGDQMHPFGRLDQATYALIGSADAEVEAKEPWCHDVTSVADVGVISVEAITDVGSAKSKTSPHGIVDAGVVRILQEGGILYDILDLESDFSPYQVLILPDAVLIDTALKTRLESYLQGGGKILATGDSGLDAERTQFLLDLGVRFQGRSPTNPSYIVPRFALRDWQTAAFVMYSPAVDIELTHSVMLADRQDAFFNRDYLHFCSHQHAPSMGVMAAPGIVGTENTVYIAWPAFRLYAEKGQNVLRDIVLHVLRTLLTKPTLVTTLPAQGIQTVMRQVGGRTIVHLLYGAPVRRGQGIEVIEDLIPLQNVAAALRVQTPPQRVLLQPQNVELPFVVKDGVMTVTVPILLCHQMIVVE